MKSYNVCFDTPVNAHTAVPRLGMVIKLWLFLILYAALLSSKICYIQCSSENSTSTRVNVTRNTSSIHYKYTVKVINPWRKSSYGVRKLKTAKRFSIVDDLKQELALELPLENDVTTIGYISWSRYERKAKFP